MSSENDPLPSFLKKNKGTLPVSFIGTGKELEQEPDILQPFGAAYHI